MEKINIVYNKTIDMKKKVKTTDIWHRKVTPEGLGTNVLLAVISLSAFSFLSKYIKNNIVFIIYLIFLFAFFVFLTYIVRDG